MRPNSVRSAIAPTREYVCLFCRLHNTLYRHPATRRYQHHNTTLQNTGKTDSPGEGQNAPYASQQLDGDRVHGWSSSNAAKKPVEVTIRPTKPEKSEKLKQKSMVNGDEIVTSQRELQVQLPVLAKQRPMDPKTRHRLPFNRYIRQRRNRLHIHHTQSYSAEKKDISLEDLANRIAVRGSGLQSLTESLRGTRTDAAIPSNKQLPVKSLANSFPKLEEAFPRAKAFSSDKKPSSISKLRSVEKLEEEIEGALNIATKKSAIEAAKKSDHKLKEKAKVAPKESKKEQAARLDEGLEIDLKATPLTPKITRKRQGKRKSVVQKIQSTAVRKVASKVKLRQGLVKYHAPRIGAPRTAGVPRDLHPNIQSASAAALQITPVNMEQPPVPSLAYGLERVLFNPGVYQLQDPRSRVYNFDPYLQKIMPIAEFDFNALKDYITSSKDRPLQQIAEQMGKRYVGSTSSMTGILAHFHFLLSQWRSINISMLSKSFPDNSPLSFTELQRTPAAIFLKWKNGSYAIDADKEFDTSNVLSMLGKSMEKLLTMKTEDYERYRRSSSGVVTEEESNSPESYHYSTLGDFLLRSQLDAHHPQLPGTGMFDLKTRAVVSIRMDVANYEHGTGYEIKDRLGEWESYEREYHDMIRAAFLKYSMQVRMGRMDGIFVAFHNVERIFGFQYVSLSEMDNTIHGQWDTTIGDQEFMLSLDLLNKLLDKATKKFPKTSIRLHFETRNAATPFMYIFAEPVTEEQVAEVQDANQAKVEEFERNILGRGSNRDEWEDIQAEVEKAMDQDELALDDEEEAFDQDRDEMDDQAIVDQNRLHADASNVDGEDAVGAFVDEDRDDLEDDGNDETDEDVEGDQEQNENEEEPESGDEDEEDENEEEHVEDEEEGGEAHDSAEEQEFVAQQTNHRHEPATLIQEESPIMEEQNVGNVENDIVNQHSGEESPRPNSTVESESASDQSESEELRNTSATSIIPDPQDSAFELPGTDETSDFATEADGPFLDVLSADSTPPHSDGPTDDILAMTLTLRNKINGQYVLRPTDMTSKDKWEIEYSIVDVPLQSRAAALYKACQARRQKILVTEAVPDGQTEVLSGYARKLREMSARGKIWRAERDEADKASGEPVKVLGEEPRNVP